MTTAGREDGMEPNANPDPAEPVKKLLTEPATIEAFRQAHFDAVGRSVEFLRAKGTLSATVVACDLEVDNELEITCFCGAVRQIIEDRVLKRLSYPHLLTGDDVADE